METMEIELTEEQLKKVEILKSKDISVGEAIDLLFEMQNQALTQLEENNNETNILSKIKDTATDTKIKEDLLKRQYEENETYDKTLQTTKHKIKWSNYFSF